MEYKEQLMVQYRNVKNALDIIVLLYAISMGGVFMSLLLLIASYGSYKLLTIYEISLIIWIIQIILFICLTILGAWLIKKENTMKEQLGIKYVEANKDEQSW